MGVSNLFGRLNERGFATLEVILMITVLGILSAVAIPRFNAITISANTAKVQADLSTLDTAIALYQMDNGKAPTKLSDLKDYVQDVENIKPPTGSIYVTDSEEAIQIPATEYSISSDTNNPRALIGNYTSDKIGKNKSS